MRVRWAAAAGIAAVLAAVVIFLSGSDHRIRGTNTVAPLISIRTLKVSPACYGVAHLPGGASYLRIRAEARSGEIDRLRAVIGNRRGNLISEGVVRDVPSGRRVDVPLQPETRGAGDALVCVYNRGREPLILFGENKRPFKGAPVERWNQELAMTFLEPEPSNWWARRGLIADRYRLGHTGVVASTGFWVAIVLALAAATLALRLVAISAAGERARRRRFTPPRQREAAPPDG